MTNAIFEPVLPSLVVVMGKVALVSLLRASDPDLLSAEELAREIRRKIESSSLSSGWIVDRVTVLDEGVPRIFSTEKTRRATVE